MLLASFHPYIGLVRWRGTFTLLSQFGSVRACKTRLFSRHLLLLFSFLLLVVGARAQALRVVPTDSSRIETRLYPGGREEKEFLLRKDLVYWRFYRGNTAQLTTTATFTKAGRTIGRWTEYDDHGQLLYVVDRDRGTWHVANRRAYPFFALQTRVKG
jgi:hypothetical protein